MKDNISLKNIKGVGEKTAQKFSSLGIHTILDLIRYYPRDYMAYEAPVSVKELREKEGYVTIAGYVQSRPVVRQANRMKITTVTVKDETGAVQLLWFHMPYLANTLRAGSYHVFRGHVQVKGSRVSLMQPEVYTPLAYEEKMQALQPLYALTKGISNHLITKTIKQAFQTIGKMEESLPESLLKAYNLQPIETALHGVHFPEGMDELKPARRRLVFEEFFYFLLALEGHKKELEQSVNGFVMKPDDNVERVISSLPYELTDDQKKTWKDMQKDFAGKHPMHRMLQGDVGSGKTILAVLGCFTAAANGYQSVIMAPTEVLAKQHYDNVCAMVKEYQLPYRVGLLVGSLTAAKKRSVQESIALGVYNIIIGTHALIQEKVDYKNLAFVVTDEQHRFGVKQREALAQKGAMPHVLVMSATPIPRTLALLLYGDLELSVIKQMPANRIPIKNCVIFQDKRETAYQFILKEIQKGRQTYVICPMVEESEMLEGENVINYAMKIKDIFPEGVKIAVLHGKMKPALKNEIMDEFAAGKIHILVSTTVIEVGINVPNATVMMIENADRFGLSQLHQLRGRVGRGHEASYCIFVSGSKKKERTERLDILNHSNDGFEIAEKDLKLRGPGDLFGIRQSGELEFKLGDIIGDSKILYEAKEAVDTILEKDPALEREENQILTEFLKYVDGNWNL